MYAMSFILSVPANGSILLPQDFNRKAFIISNRTGSTLDIDMNPMAAASLGLSLANGSSLVASEDTHGAFVYGPLYCWNPGAAGNVVINQSVEQQ